MSTPPPPSFEWATDADAQKAVITAPQQAVGFGAGQPAPAAWFNTILNRVWLWIDYLKGPRAPYVTLEGATSAMSAGDVVTIYEDDSSTIPGDLLAGYRTDGPFAKVAATSSVVLLAKANGTVYVYNRSDPGGAAVRTLTPSAASIFVKALTVYGDFAAVAAENYVSMYRISTGARLWEYNHGATVNDVQICGGYTALAGNTGTGGNAARILVTSTGAVLVSEARAVPYYACAIYGRQVAFAGAFLGTNVDIFKISGSLTLVASASIAAGNDINAMRTDGRALYLLETTGGHAYSVSWLDASVIADGDLNLGFTANEVGLAVDQGGVYALMTNIGTSSAAFRLDLRDLSTVWRASTIDNNTLGIATDGARIWTLNDTGGATPALNAYARGNCPGLWTKVDRTITTYQRFPWLLVPGVE